MCDVETNYYDVLGVDENASLDEMKTQYRKLLLKVYIFSVTRIEHCCGFTDAFRSLIKPTINYMSFPTSAVSYFMCREHGAREETMCLLRVLILT